MKDALGHGSDTRGGEDLRAAAGLPPRGAQPFQRKGLLSSPGQHAAMIAGLPKQDDASSKMSNTMWHATMPQANYEEHVKDLLGMWKGNERMMPDTLSPHERLEVANAYNSRFDVHMLAMNIHDRRDRARGVS